MATAIFIFRKTEYEVNAGMTVHHILEKIGVDSETVIPTRNGELISDDEIVQEDEVIKLVAVISGG